MMGRLKFKTVFAVSGLLALGTLAQAQEWGQQAESPEPAQPTIGAPQAEPATPSPQAELQHLQMQLQEISGQVAEIQQEAFERQDIQDASSAYEQQLRAKMVELSPEIQQDIDAAEELMDELRSVEDPGALSPEEGQAFQEKFMEFQQRAQRLQPIEEQASRDPELQAAQSALETKVLAAMADVNPQSSHLIQEREELVQRYMQLTQQLQQQQLQQPAPQPQPEPPAMQLQDQ